MVDVHYFCDICARELLADSYVKNFFYERHEFTHRINDKVGVVVLARILPMDKDDVAAPSTPDICADCWQQEIKNGVIKCADSLTGRD